MKRRRVTDRLRFAMSEMTDTARRPLGKARQCLKGRRHLKLETLEARCLLSGTPLSNDADTALLLRFNGGSQGVSGESAIAEVSVAYETGIVAQAAHTGTPGYLRYELNDNINAPAGTVEFWIKPDWNGNLNANHIFFEAGDNFNNGMLLGIDGANNLRFIQWGDDPNTPGVETSVERGIGVSGSSWLAGEWHHIAATWDSTAGEYALYVDGQLIDQRTDGVQLNSFSGTYMSIGAETNGFTAAEAAFDEFRVSTRARSAAEVLQSYQAGLGTGTPLGVWAGQHGDIWNTGRANYTVPAERLNGTFFDVFLWQTMVPGSPADGTVSSSSMAFFDRAGPAEKDIVVGGYHWPKGVQGMDRQTGEVFWFGNPDGGETIGVNTPAFSNDGSVIYVTNDATSHPLMAFSTEVGPSSYWHNGSDTNPDSIGAFSPKVAPDGTIFVNRWADRPYGATDLGDQLTTTWSAETEIHSALTEPALYEDVTGLRVVSSGRIGLIKSYNGSTGDEIWSVSTGVGTDADVTIDPANGNIYVPMGFDDIVVAGLDRNGNPLWSSTSRDVFDWIDGTNNPQRAQSGGALSHDGATFYFQTESDAGDGRLYAINTIDGSVKWSFETHSQEGESNSVSSPIVTANGVVIIGNNLGDTYYAILDQGAYGELLDSLVVDSAGTAKASATLSPDGRLYLPLRTMHTVGGGAQAPTFQVQNLFTAIDVTAAPIVVLAAPGSQRAVALNSSVELAWGAIPDPSGSFDHYVVYRSTTPFDSVAGMMPLATISDINSTTYADSTAANGTSYYYAVTTVSTSGGEVTAVESIGPRTPRDDTDLQVVSIARSPEFSRYSAQYTGYEITEPSGYGPYFFSASTGLGDGQTFSDPRFPELNEVVTYTATVRNRGTNLFGGSLSATWTLDGNVVESPVQVVSMDPGDTVTYQYTLPWDFDPHELEFTINVSDSRAANNSLTSDPLAVPFLTYIDRSFVEQFREVYTTNPATQNDDIIDWLNEHMQRFNELFAAAGTQKRVHYGVLEVVDDNTPDPAIDYSPYAIFPLRYRDDEGNPRLSGYYQSDEDLDYGLLHEMGHQLGLIDLYQLNVSPEMNLVSGQAYQTLDDLMMNVSPFLTDATAPAMEGWLREAHGYFGQYMYNLPENMQLRILGYDGQPLEGATVKVYQLAERPGVGKVISDQIKFQGTTDANGLFALPNVPINPALVPPIGTGDVLQDNPFGYLDVVGRNGVFHIQIEYDGFLDYAWLDVAEANIAYWNGQTDLAVFDRNVSLGGPVQNVPPPDMTELNAADWEAWAQSASGTVTDDTVRKLVGQSSLKFVTDGGFDTFVRYPGNINARWDLEESEFLNISFYAENPSPIGFQSGSPWIRLYDANGDYFQFQFYENGNIRDILNDARDTWVSYQIPLDADAAVVNGWRGTTYGTPDRAAISALEIHADTWDFGFTLWVDGVSFAPPPALTGDYNGDGSVNAADYTVWRDTLNSTTDLRANGDDSNSLIDTADYSVWTANLGDVPGTGAAAIAGDLQSPESAERSSSAIASGADTPVRPTIHRSLRGGQEYPPHVSARMLALLDLLDSLPTREDESEFDKWTANNESSDDAEREAAFATLGEAYFPNVEAALQTSSRTAR